MGDVRTELYGALPDYGPGRAEYTRRAFHMLPALDSPVIVDLGCGAGGPTLELARLSSGWVLGLDLDVPALRGLVHRLAAADLETRVLAVQGSLTSPSLPEAGFDVVWAEGSIYVLGLEAGLRAWRRLVRPGGCLVVHDSAWLRPNPPAAIRAVWESRLSGFCSVPDALACQTACGLEPIGHFALPEEAWWEAYYGPLAARVQVLRPAYAGDLEAQAVLDQAQQEVDEYRESQRWIGSAFYLMQRPESD